MLEFVRTFQLGGDLLRQLFAQLHAPLVKAVDIPENALGEDRVLVERNKLA